MPDLEPNSNPQVPSDFRPRIAPDGGRQALSAFADDLRREAGALEVPEFEELARAVDGELEPAQAALWQERLALDPTLARRASELASFRSEIEAGARILSFRRPAKISLSGWIAVAAVLLLAVALRQVPRLVEERGSLAASMPRLLDWSGERLFADGFEAGDASGWSSASPSG